MDGSTLEIVGWLNEDALRIATAVTKDTAMAKQSKETFNIALVRADAIAAALAERYNTGLNDGLAYRAPAAVEQVDALTDEQIANEFDAAGVGLQYLAHCKKWMTKGSVELAHLIAAGRAILAAARPAAPVQPGTLEWGQWRLELAQRVDGYIEAKYEEEGDESINAAYDALKSHILKTPFAAPVQAAPEGCRMTGGICACHSGGSYGGCVRERENCCATGGHVSAAAIKPWQERIKNGAYTTHAKAGASVVAYAGVAAQILARDAEIAELRAALRAPVQAQGVALSEREQFEAQMRGMGADDFALRKWVAVSDAGETYMNQIVQNHWRVWQARATPAQAQQSEDARDKQRLDWLEGMVVNVRENLRYGSKDRFWATPADDDGDTLPSDIRKQIDAARAIAALTGSGAT